MRLSVFGVANLRDRDWLLNEENAGCAVLLINFEGTHAELKIIDYLLASRLLTSDITEQYPYDIGISKKYWPNCSQAINIVNEITNLLLQAKNIIQFTDEHKVYAENWHKDLPIFLIEPNNKAERYGLGLYYSEEYESIGYYFHNIEGKMIDQPLKDLKDIAELNISNQDV